MSLRAHMFSTATSRAELLSGRSSATSSASVSSRGSGLGDLDRHEARAVVGVQVGHAQRGHHPVRVLDDEQQVDDAQSAVVNEVEQSCVRCGR